MFSKIFSRKRFTYADFVYYSKISKLQTAKL